MENLPKTDENLNPATEALSEPSFEDAVKESHEAIQSAEPIKRGRGRPNKGSTTATASKNPAQAKPQIKNEAPPVEYLMPVVNFPFQTLALKSGWDGWNLNPEEQRANAILLDLCLKRYLPQLQSEHAELVGLAVGLGMAGFSRYLAFKELVAQNERMENKTDKGDVMENKAPDPKIKKEVKNERKADPGIKPGNGLQSFLDTNASPAL